MSRSNKKSKGRTRARAKPKQKAKVRRGARMGWSPIPPGFRTVTPYLAIDGAARALEFYKKAFWAKELDRQATPDGKIVHARVKIGDCIVMMSDIFPGAMTESPLELGSSPVTLHIYTNDVDGKWNTAVAAGARVVMPLDNQYWGERYGQLVDPFGHHWSLSMRVKMSKEEMDAKQKAAMAMFSQKQHPSPQDQPEPQSQL